jgi:hypothetical protein
MIRRFTGALVIAAIAAASLLVTAQPASAEPKDDKSMCAKLVDVIMKIEDSNKSDIVKAAAIAAAEAAKKFAGCTAE